MCGSFLCLGAVGEEQESKHIIIVISKDLQNAEDLWRAEL